ncbi:hypothetical protein DSECCO2_470970 [anaerobic digester metagenome]
MMDLKPSTPTAGAAAHISASLTMSRAGTSQILLMASGVMAFTWALTFSKSPSRTHSSTNFLS